MRQWRSGSFEPNEFVSITTEFNMPDIYRHRHGSDEPATYQRGQKRLDYMLCTSELLPAVTACGITMPFKILSPSDHRTIFVDFDTNLLFGSLPLELASPKAKAFHSRDYESSEKYIHTVNAYCAEHNLFQRSEDAVLSPTPKSLNSLENSVGQAMQAGIKAVTKRYCTPFTPEMRRARLVRHFYNLHMQQFKIGYSRSKALSTVSTELDTPLTPPLTQRDCHPRLSAVQRLFASFGKKRGRSARIFCLAEWILNVEATQKRQPKFGQEFRKLKIFRGFVPKSARLSIPTTRRGWQRSSSLLTTPTQNWQPSGRKSTTLAQSSRSFKLRTRNISLKPQIRPLLLGNSGRSRTPAQALWPMPFSMDLISQTIQ
jgi:hypothetical protein